MSSQGEATQRADGKWEVKHADGSTEVLTDKKFHDQYEVAQEESVTKEETTEHLTPDAVRPETLPPDNGVAERLSPRDVRPETHDADDAFPEGGDFAKEYAEAVEAELAEFEDGIKEVRAELKSVKGGKAEDFGAVRAALHRLSHGKSLSRTAHVATVPHDGPERLREAPDPYETISSGPSEETNYAESRHAGR